MLINERPVVYGLIMSRESFFTKYFIISNISKLLLYNIWGASNESIGRCLFCVQYPVINSFGNFTDSKHTA